MSLREGNRREGFHLEVSVPSYFPGGEQSISSEQPRWRTVRDQSFVTSTYLRASGRGGFIFFPMFSSHVWPKIGSENGVASAKRP